jgi:hypothetical protein
MIHLRPETHSHLGWRPAKGFGFAREMAMVPLAATEISRVAQSLPVLFGHRAGRWQAVAVLGPVQGANVHVTREGKWRASFVPALLKVYPFRLDDDGQLALWAGYEPFPLASDGVQPFHEDGGLEPRLQQALKLLRAVHTGMGAVHPVLERLYNAGALTPWEMPGIESPQAERALKGLYAIDTVRFEALGDAAVLELFRTGVLGWLHAHLDSLHHAERFKELAKSIVGTEIAAPRQHDKIDQVADFLAAIAEDLGDAEL